MKKFLSFIAFSLISFVGFSQNKGISYQAVIIDPNPIEIPGKDVTAQPYVSKDVWIRFGIYAGTTLQYEELHKTKTDEYGLVNLIIGGGVNTGKAGTFTSLSWDGITKNIVTNVSFDQGGRYTEVSNQKFTYVPYTLLAETAVKLAGVLPVSQGGTGATNAIAARTNLGLGNVDNTADVDKQVSIPTLAILDTKESLANKSTNIIADSASSVKYPSVKAIKDYIDNRNAGLAQQANNANLAAKASALETPRTINGIPFDGTANITIPVGVTPPDADATTKGLVKLAGDLSGTADAPAIATGAVTTGKLAAGAVTDAKITSVAGSKVTGNIAGNAGTATKLAATKNINGVPFDGSSDITISASASTLSGTIAIANGGTGATTAADARTNLGLVIGTDVLAQRTFGTAANSAATDFVAVTEKGANNGVATLGVNGKIPSVQIPSISFQSVSVVNSDATMTAISGAQVGSIAIRSDQNINYVLSALPATTLSNWIQLAASTDVSTINGLVGPSVNLSTNEIPEGATNKYYTDARVRGAISATGPLSYNASTGNFSMTAASASANGYLSSADFTTFNNKQTALTAGIDYVTPSGNITGNAANVTGIVSIANGGTGTSTATGALVALGAEPTDNKSNNILIDGNSTTKFPSFKAIKDYVDQQSANAGVADNSITSAKINGTLAVLKGGTGASNAADARTNLGLVIGTDVMAANFTTTLTGDVAGSGNGSFATTVNSVGGVSSSTIATLPTNVAANTASITANTSDILLKAPLASPTFTGTPTAPTPATSDNSTKVATTEYVKNSIVAANAGLSSIGAISGTSNAKGATISGTTELILTPADASNGGVVTNGTQTFAGAKTFSNDMTVREILFGYGTHNKTNNIAIGRLALNNNTSDYNVAIGNSANSQAASNSGGYNVALGYQAMRFPNSRYNVAIGSQSFYSSAAPSSGDNNVAVGYQALYNPGTGANNTVLGYQSLYNGGANNSILGAKALYNAAGASNNVAVGDNAGLLFGSGSGTALTSSTQSIFIGSGVRAGTNTSTNEIAIGYNVVGNGSNTVTIGNNSITANYFKGDINLTGNLNGGTWSGTTIGSNYGGAGTVNGILKANGSGVVSAAVAGTDYLTPSGNAASATILATARNINGVAFDGSANITIAADANTLTGTTLASNITASSLTSVGTITSGIWSATTIDIAKGGTGATTAADARTNLGLTIGTDVMAANFTTTLTGDVTGAGNGSFATTLVNSGVTSGTYGSSTAIPTLTVDSKGRITSASTVGIIAGVNSLNYTSTTSYASGGTISGTSLTLAAANATNPGLISTGAQTIAGAKTFSSDATINGLTVGLGTGSQASNAVLGKTAMANNTTGNNTVAIGFEALKANTFSNYNTAIGSYALSANNNADANVAVGVYALTASQSGGYNTAVGSNSLAANINGYQNTAVGNTALFVNTSGIYNTAVGNKALFSNITGSNNTALGHEADVASAALTNATAIGNGAIVDASNKIQLGNSSVTSVVTSGTISATGFRGPLTGNATTATTATNLAGGVAGSIPYQTAAGTTAMIPVGSANQFLTSVAGGTYTWTSTSAVTGNFVPYSGASGSVDLGAYDLTVNGLTVGRGGGSKESNTAFGYQSMLSNTDGINNTSFGNSALKANTTGSANTAIGMYALIANTTGSYNLAIGMGSLDKLTSGSNNIAIGPTAGRNISGGSLNLTTSSNSIYIGSSAMAKASSSLNEIVIGHGATGNGSNTVTIGNSTTVANYFTGSINLTGSINGGTWSGTTIGSNYGGAGSINGLLKANGTGVVSAAISGTDYQAPLTAGSGISIASGTISATGLTNANLSSTAGITNAQLANSSTILGSTSMTLGGTVTSVTGLTSLAATNLTGTLSGTATGLATGRTISTTGDVVYTSGAFDGTTDVTGSATLTNTTVTAGTYGSSTAIPTFTVDSKGRLTAAGTVGITAGVNSLNYTSTTSYAAGGTISGTSLTLAAADGTNPGLLSTGAQTIAGAKTFSADITAPNFLGNATTATTAGNITATSNTTLTSLANLATVGTITSGTWSASTIDLTKGGTGATTASGARTNLGLVIGTDVMAANFTTTLTGDVTGAGNGSFATTLANSGVASGTYGSSTAIPVLTVDSKGRVITASTVGIVAGVNSLNYTSSTSYAAGGTISGTSLTLAAADGTNPGLLSTGAQNIAGAKTFSTDITAPNFLGNATTATTAGNITATSNTTLTSLANLATVGTITSGVWSGTAIANNKLANSTTTLGSTTMTLGGTVTSVAGLTSLSATNLTGTLSGTATSLATGRTIALTGDVTYTSPTFDGTSNVTAAATLAASGVASGTYGSSTAIPVLTVDTKGRVTTASTVSIIAGVNTMTAISATSNANGATISGTALTLTPANASFGGVVTTGTQTFAGAKTFSSDITVNGITVGEGGGSVAKNTAIGLSAMSATATGAENTAVGNVALTALTAGTYNVAVGSEASKAITTGTDNVAVGYQTLYAATNASFNTAIGNYALKALNSTTTNDRNTAIGVGSLAGLTAGQFNTTLGQATLQGMTTGSNNVSIGRQAGFWSVGGTTLVTTADNSVFIGADTKPAAVTTSNEIIIGYGAQGAGSNTTTIGNSNMTNAKIFGALNLPITTASTSTTSGALTVGGGAGIAGNVYIGGTLSIAGGTPAAGDVLTSDANGLATWSAPAGITTMAAIGSTANANGATISGSTLNLQPANASFGGVVTTVAQTFAGAKTFDANIVSNGVKLGSVGGSNNVLVGGNAMNTTTTSDYNTAIGSYTLNKITSGQFNTALGYASLYNLTTGTENVAVGSSALNTQSGGGYNVAVGNKALKSSTTSTQNVALGYWSGYYLTTGGGNTLLGNNAGAFIGATGTVANTTGANSTLIGINTSPLTDGDVNEVVIAGGSSDRTVGLGSNSTLIGNSATTLTQLMGVVNIPNSTASTSSTTGALKVAGGVGIGGKVNLGANTNSTSTTSGTLIVTGGVGISGNLNFGGTLNDLTTKAAGTGTNNTAYGKNALIANTTGYSNTAIGYEVLKLNTDGAGNTALGVSALNKFTSGTSNIAIGVSAIEGGTGASGSSNVGVGNSTLSTLTTGNSNSAFGNSAGGGLTTGQKNVFVGNSAGENYGSGNGNMNSTGSNSLFVGYQTRPAANGETNEMVIAAYDGTAPTVGLGSHTTLIGNGSTTFTALMGDVGIGSTTDGGAFKLQVTGDTKLTGRLTITGGTPGAGKVLISDANGLASWSNGVGSPVTTTTAAYVITLAESIVFYTGSAAGTFSIPAAASTNTGKEITIKNKTGYGITITPATGSIYIDNANSAAASVSIGIEASNNWIKLVSDGTQWNVLRALF